MDKITPGYFSLVAAFLIGQVSVSLPQGRSRVTTPDVQREFRYVAEQSQRGRNKLRTVRSHYGRGPAGL